MSWRALHEPYEHAVQFYGLEHDAVGAAASHFEHGLAGGDDTAVVITGRSRMDAIERHLRSVGVDVDSARTAGRLIWRDSSETLTKITRAGRPDPRRFDEVIGRLVHDAARTRPGIRIFGDMVALLWSAGDQAGALRLEGMWNQLASRHAFSLLCAYPMDQVSATGDVALVGRVCDTHSHVIPPIDPNALLEEFSPDDTSRSRVYLASPTTIRAVRQLVRNTLELWGRTDLVDDSALIVSELASNVVNHVSGPYRVVIERAGDSITVAVHDRSSHVPIRRHPAATQVGGRGLRMIDELATTWGTRATAHGKVVWATFDRSPTC